jgi:rRNA small subunit pseudouridine methyltransferase Nep1
MSSSSEDESSSASADEEEEEVVQERPSKKTKKNNNNNNDLLSSVPLEIAPTASSSLTTTSSKKSKGQPIIVVLDQATLETVKNRRGVYELLNCDDHREICKKKLHKDPNEFRPDILHQELLALLDSPLNKAGLLQIYISTVKKVLIEVNPSIRIPRTYKRFAGLMVQLLHKMKIKAGTESTTLLQVIKNPMSRHLPPGTRCYGFSCEGTLYSPIALAKSILPLDLPDSVDEQHPPTCFVVGAMSTGHVTITDHPYIEKMISVSNYPLSGASALSRIMGGIEHHWGIV